MDIEQYETPIPCQELQTPKSEGKEGGYWVSLQTVLS